MTSASDDEYLYQNFWRAALERRPGTPEHTVRARLSEAVSDGVLSRLGDGFYDVYAEDEGMKVVKLAEPSVTEQLTHEQDLDKPKRLPRLPAPRPPTRSRRPSANRAWLLSFWARS